MLVQLLGKRLKCTLITVVMLPVTKSTKFCGGYGRTTVASMEFV